MTCEHMDMIVDDIQPRTSGCEECMQQGKWWVRLRMCLVCGHVGCCETSPGNHARAHFQETGHPIMRSFEPNQAHIRWCFLDDEVV